VRAQRLRLLVAHWEPRTRWWVADATMVFLRCWAAHPLLESASRSARTA
jgi:hypothetical protein